MTSPHALIAEARRLGVRVQVAGGRLVALPPGRLPSPLASALRAHRKAIAAHLMEDAGTTTGLPPSPLAYLSQADEAAVVAIGNEFERLADKARTTRLRYGSGWPGVAEKDRAVLRAREYLRTRRTGSMDAPK